MKKIVLCAALVLSVLLIFACKSKAEVKDDLESIYTEYSGVLILEGAEKYVVKSGDTLSKIAKEKYGNGFYFPIIVLASIDVVKDFDQIEPDMELTIPDLQINLDDANAKKRIKSFLIDIAGAEEDRNRPKDAAGMRALSGSL